MRPMRTFDASRPACVCNGAGGFPVVEPAMPVGPPDLPGTIPGGAGGVTAPLDTDTDDAGGKARVVVWSARLHMSQ